VALSYMFLFIAEIVVKYTETSCRNISAFDSRLGCPDSTVPDSKPTPHSGASRSMFVAADVTFQGHPRFR